MEDILICAIIVTYNRKQSLIRCIEAVARQTRPPKDIIIIDNASSDNTYDHIITYFGFGGDNFKEEILVPLGHIGGCTVKYYRKSINEGGAGGFYDGIRLAHESRIYSSYWLMDDDGYPSDCCLEVLLSALPQYDYVMPVSIDIDDAQQLSWATRKIDGKKTTSLEELRKSWGDSMPFIFPFNGSLLSRKLVTKVGYINPKLFIWGDDYEHYYRCLKAKFNPITLLYAEFYHPVNKTATVPILFGKVHIPYVESKLRFICLIRNWIFIYKTNYKYHKIIQHFIAYTWLFLITRRMDIKGYELYLQSFIDGLIGNFERHKKFL